MQANMLPYNDQHTIASTKPSEKDCATMTKAKTVTKCKVYKHAWKSLKQKNDKVPIEMELTLLFEDFKWYQNPKEG